MHTWRSAKYARVCEWKVLSKFRISAKQFSYFTYFYASLSAATTCCLFFFFSFHRKSTTRRRLNHEYLTCRISQGKCSQLVGLPHRTLACPSWRLCSKLAVQIVAKVVNTHRLRRAAPRPTHAWALAVLQHSAAYWLCINIHDRVESCMEASSTLPWNPLTLGRSTTTIIITRNSSPYSTAHSNTSRNLVSICVNCCCFIQLQACCWWTEWRKIEFSHTHSRKHMCVSLSVHAWASSQTGTCA